MNKTLSIILLFIAGLFVGCERYDHLIQDLNDRIEVLEGATIAPITEQIKQINVSYTDLTTVDTALEALIKDLSEELLKLQQQADENSDAIAEITALIKELQDRDAALDQQIKDLKSYLDDEIKAAKYWAEATFATLEQYAEMQTEISRISALIEAYKAEQENDYTEAIDKAVTDVLAAITVSETSMKEWVNKILAEGYYDIAQIDAILFALETKLVGSDAELTKEIEAQQAALELAKTDLTDAYKKAIKEAIEENNGKISKEIADAVQAALDNVDAKLAAINAEVESIKALINSLKETVNNLVGRIQSMRFIPEFSDGKVALGLGERTAELTFMISPRDVAAGVAAAWASSNDVVTAFIKPTQPRTKASYDMEALAVTNVTGNANGTLVVTISTEDLSEDFWYEGIEANVFVCISDGNNDIISEMIPIYYVEPPYVTFKASAAQTLKINRDVTGLQFSIDNGATWHSLTASTANATFGPDNDLLLRGINSGGTGSATISFTDRSVPVACSGDIRTLVDYRNYANVDTGSAKFTYLFSRCTVLTSAPELPATTLARSCYSNMFNGCTGLTKAPSLPATQLANYCYNAMFNGCTGLMEAPELPATQLVDHCYYSMFGNCTGLKVAPNLPATILAQSCYGFMFASCTGLTAAPELPAKILATNCYSYMFSDCSNLNKITMLATDVSASDCLKEWVGGVAQTGTFTKVAEVTLTTGVSGIPSGWTVIQEASKGVEAPDFGFGGSFSN